MRPGVTINITFGGYNDVPNDRWIFVRDRDIERHDIDNNYIDRSNNITIINNSTVINKTYYDNKRQTTYITGPSREDVQKFTGRTIKPVVVHERNKPGQSWNNDQLLIYRPQVQKNKKGNKPAPTELTKINDVKRISERDAEKKPQIMQQQKNRIGKGQPQTEVNSSNKIDSKNRTYQPRNLDPTKNENKKDQLPQMRNPNPPIDNVSKNKSNQPQYLDHPKKENKMVHPLPPKNIIETKNNNTDQPPRTQTVNPSRQNKIEPVKSHSTDQPSNSDPNKDKKENRKLK